MSVPRTALWTHCAPVDFSEFFDGREDRDVRADVFNWVCSVVARFAASRRSAQLTSADLCLDFLYRNPLLGGRCKRRGFAFCGRFASPGAVAFLPCNLEISLLNGHFSGTSLAAVA